MPVAIPVGAKADEASFKSVADQVERVFTELGGKIGKDLSGSLVDGLTSGEKTVRQSAEKVAKSYDKVADATGRVKTLQEQLNAAQDSGNTARIVAQTERLEAARRKESQAIRQTINDLRDYEDQARKASSSFGSAFSSGFGRSHVGGMFSGLKGEAESAGAAAGMLAGRAMGAALTTGLATAAAGAAAVIGGIGYTLTKGFERLKNIDNAEFKLKALGHTGGEVKRIMADAEASVKGTAFSLDAAVGAAAASVAAGVNPGEDLTRYLTTIGDAAAISGKSFDEMASIFNKVQANGRAFTIELMQLSNAGLPVFTWLQKATGLAGDDFRKFVEKGGVDARMFRAVLEENIGGSALRMGESFSGAMDNLGAAIGRLGAAALAAPFGQASDVIGKLTSKLDDMTAWMKANQPAVIDFWVKMGDVATYAAQTVAVAAGGILKSISFVVNAVGDTLGALGKIPGLNKMLFYDNGIDPDSFFGWADGINRAVDDMIALKSGIGDVRNSIRAWGDDAKTAAPLTQALGTTDVAVKDGEATIDAAGVAGVASPGGVRDKLGMLGIGLAEGPEGRLKLVPQTEEATRALEAWKRKQGESIGGPVGPGLGGSDPASFTVDPNSIGGGGKGAKEHPYFDESLWSLKYLPVPGTYQGPTNDSSILNARTRVEEARLRLLELEHQGNVAQSTLVSAKNNVVQAERALRDAESRAAEAQLKSLQRHTGALEEIGAKIDQDFGISKGLPGIAENLTKFLANLAMAPVLGALQAIAGPTGGGAASAIGGYGVPGLGGGRGGRGGSFLGIPGLGGFLGGGGMGGYGGVMPMPTGMPRQYQQGMVPNNVQLLSVLEKMFPGVKMSADTSRVDQYNEHGSGEALDIMVGANAALGRQINDFLITNAKALGLQYTLWQQATWRPDRTVSPMETRANGDPTQNHMDHVHARVKPGPATGAGGVSIPSIGGGLGLPMPALGGYGSYGGGYGYTPSYAPSAIGGDGGSLPGLGIPGLTPTMVPGAGQGVAPATIGPGGVPAPASLGVTDPLGGPRDSLAPSAVAPSTGAGGEGFAGLTGAPMDALMTATSALDVLAPGTSIVAQKGIQLINRAIGYGGQVAGIGVSGLLNTFLPRGSTLADFGNSWVGRIASGFAGARPAGNNMAGQSTMPNPDDVRQQQQGGDTNNIDNTTNITVEGRNQDDQQLANEVAFQNNQVQTYMRPGMR